MPTEKNTENDLAGWCLTQLTLLEREARPKHVFGDVSISLEALRVEASHRQFYRAHSNNANRSWVAMWSPPTLENNRQFAALAQIFQTIGTPQLLASDFERGFFLMEDLGSLHLSDAYESAAGDSSALQQLVHRALDALLPLQEITHPAIPSYDETRLLMEFDLCAEWFAKQLIQTLTTPAEAKALAHARETLVQSMLEQPTVCVHRDYHCRNLLLRGEAGEQSRIGMVDFQDALIGPVLYDPASLLRDCYFSHEESLVRTALDRFADRHPLLANIPPDTVLWWHDACAIQRQIKAVGIFARLHLRDGKSSHLRHIPSVLKRAALVADQYPDLAALAQLLDRWATQASQHTLIQAESNPETYP